eukprot:scaffold327569_cov35-Attheya_sp.AAC.1
MQSRVSPPKSRTAFVSNYSDIDCDYSFEKGCARFLVLEYDTEAEAYAHGRDPYGRVGIAYATIHSLF